MDQRITQLLLFIIIFMAGFILGQFILSLSIKPTGELVVDTSDPKKDRWLIKLEEPTSKMAKRHMAVLKVTHRRMNEGEEEIWPNER